MEEKKKISWEEFRKRIPEWITHEENLRLQREMLEEVDWSQGPSPERIEAYRRFWDPDYDPFREEEPPNPSSDDSGKAAS